MGQGVRSGGLKVCIVALVGVLPGGDTTSGDGSDYVEHSAGVTRTWPLPASLCAGFRKEAFHNHELCIRTLM